MKVLINFLGWAFFTYTWLGINFTFANAIRQVIADHDEAIRQEIYDAYDAAEEV